jgi:hypothetical protein
MIMDHGILNIPLSKRGDIDAQIDRYKAEQAAIAKAKAQADFAQAKIDRASAHELLDAAEKPRIQHLAERSGRTFTDERRHLRSECHWQPKLVIALLS